MLAVGVQCQLCCVRSWVTGAELACVLALPLPAPRLGRAAGSTAGSAPGAAAPRDCVCVAMAQCSSTGIYIYISAKHRALRPRTCGESPEWGSAAR